MSEIDDAINEITTKINEKLDQQRQAFLDGYKGRAKALSKEIEQLQKEKRRLQKKK